MHSGDELPQVNKNTPLRHALLEMTTKGFGMTTVVNDSGELTGVFTDGDLRRAIDNKIDINNTPIGELTKTGCRAVHRDLLAAEALKIIEDFKITALVVEDSDHHPIGVLHMHDILRAGVM
jgi:arabinose-5-phosphate isomerase